MNSQLKDLIQFYSQQHHVPIRIIHQQYEIEEWNRNGIIVAISLSGSRTIRHDDLELRIQDALGSNVLGADIEYGPYCIGVISESMLLVRFVCDSDGTHELARKLIEKHLPNMCRKARRQSHDSFMESMNSCRDSRQRDLRVAIRDDEYEVQRLSVDIVTASRRLQTNRHMAAILDKPEDWLLRRHQRMSVELSRLVPGSYAGFKFDDTCIIGTTHPIIIEFEGFDYLFDPYDVTVDFSKPEIRIEGGTDVNDYLHPHVAAPDNICWGNIGGLVNQLLGQMDLPGLFQLIHQFLHTYNESDPFQKIQFWDPNYIEEDDEEPYCSFCDDYGHTVQECEWCWWCEYCQAFVDHPEQDCPNRKEEEDEELVETAA